MLVLKGYSQLWAVCRLGQKGVDAASDSSAPAPDKVHVQDTGLESTTVASIVAGAAQPSRIVSGQTMGLRG